MKVLVTGGAGYVGSHVLIQLRRAGHDPVVFDDLSRGHRAAVRDCILVTADLADEGAALRALRDCGAEAVMHFAASAYVGESVSKPEHYYFNNVVNTLRLLRVMRQAGVDRFVFSSSCAVYGVPAEIPIREAAPLRPVSPYGRTKAAIEWALEDYAHAYGLRYASLRYFNAAGAAPDGTIGEDHDPETHLIPLAIAAALGLREEVCIFGTDYPTPDGTCVRDYVHVMDLATAHVMALEALDAPGGTAYNLGTGRGYSVREVIRTVEEVSGTQLTVREGPRREGDPPELVGSPDKVRDELGWEPRFPSLRDIVESAWKWHSSHPEGFGPS